MTVSAKPILHSRKLCELMWWTLIRASLVAEPLASLRTNAKYSRFVPYFAEAEY